MMILKRKLALCFVFVFLLSGCAVPLPSDSAYLLPSPDIDAASESGSASTPTPHEAAIDISGIATTPLETPGEQTQSVPETPSPEPSFTQTPTATPAPTFSLPPAAPATHTQNPGIFLSVDKAGYVQNHYPRNESGRELLEDIKITGLKIGEASELLLQRMIQRGYLRQGQYNHLILLTGNLALRFYRLLGSENGFELIDYIDGEFDDVQVYCEPRNIVFDKPEGTITSSEVDTFFGFTLSLKIETDSNAYGRTDLNGTMGADGIITEGYHFDVGEIDEFGELVLYADGVEHETDAGYMPFDDLPEASKQSYYEIYSPEDIEMMRQPRRYVTMPNVVGLTEAEARSMLNSRGIIVRVSYEWRPELNIAEGVCFAQDVVQGQRMNTDASIFIWVMKQEAEGWN